MQFFFFWKYFYFCYTTFLYLSTRSSGHHQNFCYSRFFSRKSQSQQRLVKKIIHFTIQFRSKNLTYFTNLNSLHIENNMLPRYYQKSFSFYKFSSKHISVWCHKKHLHCTISWRSRTASLEALWKQMPVYFCISPKENSCSTETVRFYLVILGVGGGAEQFP